MASGSYGNGAGGGCALRISWSSSAGTGGSTVSASLIAQNQNGYYWYARVYAYGITINGSQVTGSNAALSSTANGASTLISHSVWVGYTGNKSITISGYANFGSAGISGLGNQTISGTATLDKVGSAPSMGSITAPSTGTWSETTTGITVSWNAGSSYNNSGKYRVDVSINGGAYNWVSGDLSWGTTSWTYGITPSQGTTYQFRVCCGNDVGWSSHQYSGVVTLNTINPPTIGSLGTFNPYVNSTYTVPLSGGSQTNGGAFKRCANIHVNGTYKYAGNFPSSNGNTSVTITVTPANIASDLGKNAYSSSTMFSIIAWCENANGTRSSYVGKNFTVNLNSDGKAVPSLSDFTISGGAFSNPATCFIAGVTNVNVSGISASANRYPSGTSISYTVSCTGVGNQYGQNVTFSGLGAGVKTITVTARDSRGLSTSVSKQIKVQSYSAPVIRNYSVVRDSTTQTSAKIAYTLSYSPIYSYANGYNTATSGNLNGISYQSYSKDGSTWTACKTGDTITGLSTESVYNIQLCIADNVRTSGWVYASYKVPTIKTNVAIRKNGIGINCVPQNSYALEVDGAGHVTGLMNVDGNLNGNGQLNVAGDATLKSNAYITKSLGVTGNVNVGSQIIRNGGASSWIGGRDVAMIRKTSSGGYQSILSMKTPDGSWEIGNYDESYIKNKFVLSYITDSNYNSNNNVTTAQFAFPASGGWVSLFRDIAFPVGAVYITYNNNNPGNFLGGTWTQFGQGRVLVGQGTGSDGSTSMTFTSGGDTGGTYFPIKDIGVTAPQYGGIGGGINAYSGRVMSIQVGKENDKTVMKTFSEYGYSGSQPYFTVYFWRRTA